MNSGKPPVKRHYFGVEDHWNLPGAVVNLPGDGHENCCRRCTRMIGVLSPRPALVQYGVPWLIRMQ